jgi:hypothetical protein
MQQMLSRTLFIVSAVLVVTTYLNIALVIHTLQVQFFNTP